MGNNDIFSKLGKFAMELNESTLHTTPKYGEMNAATESMLLLNQKKAQRELEYKESVLNALRGIEKNTALFTEMTLLLQKSNDKQDEMFQLMVEILEIMKSSNKEEADSKFTKVMQKITTFTENASAIQSLVGMANTVYNALPF